MAPFDSLPRYDGVAEACRPTQPSLCMNSKAIGSAGGSTKMCEVRWSRSRVIRLSPVEVQAL